MARSSAFPSTECESERYGAGLPQRFIDGRQHPLLTCGRCKGSDLFPQRGSPLRLEEFIDGFIHYGISKLHVDTIVIEEKQAVVPEPF